MTVALVSFVGHCEAKLPRMLESIGPDADGRWPFDEYVFGVDRTSTDGTRRLVEDFCVRALQSGPSARIYDGPSPTLDPGGFAACWNPLFASVASDWHLHVASDEAMLRAGRLREVLAALPEDCSAAGLLFREVLVDRPVVTSVRCLRTRSNARYEGSTHSQLVSDAMPLDPARVHVPSVLPDVGLEHYKSADDYAESRARHLAMAKAAVERGDEPRDYNLYLLGQAFLEAGDEPAALEAFSRAKGVASHGGRDPATGHAVAPWIPFCERIVQRLHRKATGQRPFLALAVICKNAGETIDGLLRSTVGCAWGSAFDEYVFVDTGSSDGTVTMLEHWKAVAEAHGARFEIIEAGDAFVQGGVFNFAAARNCSFAKATAEWIGWLDCDDVILGADYLWNVLRKIDSAATCVSLKYDYSGDGAMWQDKHRIFHVSVAPTTWHGRLHESTTTPDGYKVVMIETPLALGPPFNAQVPFHVRHGNLHPERSTERNDAILRSIYDQDGPTERARAAYFLGRSASMRGDSKQAEAFLREAATAFPWNYIGLLASVGLSEVLCAAGDYEAALAVAGEAHARLPEHPEPIWSLAMIHRARNDTGRASLWFRKALAMPDDQWRSHRNERLERHDGPLMAAETFRRIGALDEAQAAWAKVAPDGGDYKKDDLHRKVGNAIARDRYLRDVVAWANDGVRLMCYASEGEAMVRVLDALPEWARRHPACRRLRAAAYDKVAHKDSAALYAERYAAAFDDANITWVGDRKAIEDLRQCGNEFIAQLGRAQRLLALARDVATARQDGPHILAIGPNGGFIEAYTLRNVSTATCAMVETSEATAKALRDKWGAEFGGRVRTLATMNPAGWPLSEAVPDKRGLLVTGLGFDIVAIFEVIEHIPDPVAFLRAARDRLAPGGVLLLSTPDVSSAWLPDLEAEKAAWLGHLRGYTPEILRDHLRAAGLEVRRMETDSNDLLLTEAVAMGAASESEAA